MRRRKNAPLDMSEDARQERAAAACIFGNPLNGEVYDPRDNQMLPKAGGWCIITRPLPPMERRLDEQVTMGRVFWCDQVANADERGFLPDGQYKVLCRSPFGDLCLWPYEYRVLDSAYLTMAWQEGGFTFHPSEKSEDQFSEQLFYCLSRGIQRADAVVMCLGTMSGPVGWFEPSEEVADFVAGFQNVGAGLMQVNHDRRAAARAKRNRA